MLQQLLLPVVLAEGLLLEEAGLLGGLVLEEGGLQGGLVLEVGGLIAGGGWSWKKGACWGGWF